MATTAITDTTRGALFGAAITAAGVHLPGVIVGQLTLHESHMLKTFLTASASSALVFELLSLTGIAKLAPRSPSSLNRLGKYDGNVLGGALIGIGMALTGACPGSVFAQVGAGIPSGVPALLGGALGGVAYVGVAPRLVKKKQPQQEEPTTAVSDTKKTDQKPSDKTTLPSPSPSRPSTPDPLHLSSKLNVSPHLALLLFEASLLLGIGAFSRLQRTPHHLLHPVAGGLLIGAAQLASVLLSGNGLGISGAFQEAGAWFWHAVGGGRGGNASGDAAKRPGVRNICFAAGAVAGAYVLTRLAPASLLLSSSSFLPPQSSSVSSTSTAAAAAAAALTTLPLLHSLAGGFLMAFGSRLAGGCTSGHGITGMSLLSKSSFVTVGAMFGAGIASALVVYGS